MVGIVELMEATSSPSFLLFSLPPSSPILCLHLSCALYLEVGPCEIFTSHQLVLSLCGDLIESDDMFEDSCSFPVIYGRHYLTADILDLWFLQPVYPLFLNYSLSLMYKG